MDDQQDDSVYINSEGELAEDALYEWDGEQWVTKTHEPFKGFERPLEDPAHLEDLGAPSLRFRNRDLGSYLGASVIMVLSVFTCMLVILAAMRVREFLDSRPREVAIVPTIIRTPPTQAPTPTPANTETPQPSIYERCRDGLFSPAYVFVYGAGIRAQSLQDRDLVCSLLSEGQLGIDPHVSPDGRRLYYRIDDELRYRELDTDEDVLLYTFDFGVVQRVDLSPDGERFVFAHNGDLHILDVTTGVISDVTGVPDEVHIGFAVWSSDGAHILFSSQSRIARIAADGSDYTVIFDDPERYPFVSMVDWSPDGLQIAAVYATSFNSQQRGLIVVDSTGSQVRTIVGYGTQLSDPRWLPDGRHIAVISGTGGYSVVTIYDLEGRITQSLQPYSSAAAYFEGLDVWYAQD